MPDIGSLVNMNLRTGYKDGWLVRADALVIQAIQPSAIDRSEMGALVCKLPKPVAMEAGDRLTLDTLTYYTEPTDGTPPEAVHHVIVKALHERWESHVWQRRQATYQEWYEDEEGLHHETTTHRWRVCKRCHLYRGSGECLPRGKCRMEMPVRLPTVKRFEK